MAELYCKNGEKVKGNIKKGRRQKGAVWIPAFAGIRVLRAYPNNP
jgi:hypothetical protein